MRFPLAVEILFDSVVELRHLFAYYTEEHLADLECNRRRRRAVVQIEIFPTRTDDEGNTFAYFAFELFGEN